MYEDLYERLYNTVLSHRGARPRQVEEGYGRVPQSLVHPRTLAGDIIIFCGFGSAHGVGAWGSDHERRLVIVNYQVRRAWGAAAG